jgi:hypothetical protein
MSGRLTLAFYKMMGLHKVDSFSLKREDKIYQEYKTPIVNSINEFVTIAMLIAHQSKTRAHYCEMIMNRRFLLFTNRTEKILLEWRAFAVSALINATTSKKTTHNKSIV